jgi:hypothetical protein
MLNDIWLKHNKKIFYGNQQAVRVQQTLVGSTLMWTTEVQNVGDVKG